MDGSVEAFIQYRLQRFESISEDLSGYAFKNLIPEICGILNRFALKRPKHAFFRTAKGTRFVRTDLKYFFPAVVGIDIRPYIKGQHLWFEPDPLLQDKKLWNATTRQQLIAVTRLLLLLSTYNFHQLNIEDIVAAHPDLHSFAAQAKKNQADVISLTAGYLRTVQGIPAKAHVMSLHEAELAWDVNPALANDLQNAARSQILQQHPSILLSFLESQFESLCSGMGLQLNGENLMIDPHLNLEVDFARLIKLSLSDQHLLNVLRWRYDHASYLYAARLYETEQTQNQTLHTELQSQLERKSADLNPQESESLTRFMQGIPVTAQASFYFDEFQEESIRWTIPQRRAAYLGKVPEYQKSSPPSPSHYPLAEEVRRAEKRPVCLLLDISGSMTGCLDIAFRAVEELLVALVGHPIHLAFFSEVTGVVNQGQPLFNESGVLREKLEWVYAFIETAFSFSGLGLATSLGNGILQATALTVETALQMDRYKEWRRENGIVAHCILISDNCQNTPRDVSIRLRKEGYLMKHRFNVAVFAADKGCSIHNMVCCDPPPRYRQRGQGALSADMQKMRYKASINSAFLEEQGDQPSAYEHIRRQLYVADEVVADFQDRLQKRANVYFHKNKQPVFSVLIQTDETSLDVPGLVTFAYFVRTTIQEDVVLHNALDFLCREFQCTSQVFFTEPVDLNEFSELYQYLRKKEWLEMEKYEFSHLDASPFIAHEVSSFISESQLLRHQFPTTPVLLTVPQPVPRGQYRLSSETIQSLVQRLEGTHAPETVRQLAHHLQQLVDHPFDNIVEFESALDPIFGEEFQDTLAPYTIESSFIPASFCAPEWFSPINLEAIGEAVDCIVEQLHTMDTP